jgi:hypothetical protein
MAEVTPTVYTAGRVAVSSANYSDNLTAATAGNNYNIANNGRVGLMLECTAGGTATVATPNSVDGNAIADLTLTLTAAKIKIWGGFPPAVYNNSSGNVVVTVSAATNLFAFRLG